MLLTPWQAAAPSAWRRLWGRMADFVRDRLPAMPLPSPHASSLSRSAPLSGALG